MKRIISKIFIITFLGSDLVGVPGQIPLDDVPEELKTIAISDVDKWEGPEILQKRCPYYLSGYDGEGRAIWVAPLGKWPVVDMLSKGPEWEEMMYKHIHKTVKLAFEDINKRGTKEKPIDQINLIIDMKDFSFAKAFESPKGVKYITDTLRLFANVIYSYTNIVWIVNANFITERVLEMMRPVLGRAFEKVEIFGTNTQVWIPKLLKILPKDQLPPQLGGYEGFKPVKLYG